MCKNHREDKFLRATNYKHYGCDNKPVSSKRTAKHEKRGKHKGFKALSYAIAVSLAAAALIVPTTTLAPDVDAFEDSRAASLAVGNINDFSLVITNNCVEETTAPITQEVTTSAQTTQKQTEKATEAVKAVKKTKKAVQSSQQVETTAPAEPSETESSYQESYNTSSQSSSEVSSESSDTSSTESYTESTTSDTESYQSGYLLSISNPDSSYNPKPVSLSAYDREKLERLVMGEGGSMGYTGCALIAQSIRDAMNRSNTTSIDRIISEYQYFGSTAKAPNQNVKNAVSYIFDQNGSAVQHRVICFYVGSSNWHETQNYITSIGSVRFFDLWY